MTFFFVKPNDNIQHIINFADTGDTIIFPAIKIDLKKYYLKSGIRYVGVGTVSKSFTIEDNKDIEITGFIFKKSLLEKLTTLLLNKYNPLIRVNRSSGIKITHNTFYG